MADVHLDALYKVLKSSKDVFWFENKHLSEKEKQVEWTKRFEELANRLGASPQSPDDVDENDPQSPKRRMTRSMSSDQPLSKRRDIDSTTLQPVELQRHASTAGTPFKPDAVSAGPWTDHRSVYRPTHSMQMPRYLYSTDTVTNHSSVQVSSNPQSLPTSHELSQPTFVPCLQSLSVEEYIASHPPHERRSSSSRSSFSTGEDSSTHSPLVQLSSPSNVDLQRHEQTDALYPAASVGMTRATTLASEPLTRTTTNQMICSPMDALHVASCESTEEYTAFSGIAGDSRKMNDVSSSFFPTDSMFLSSNPILSPESSIPPISLSMDPSFPYSVAMAHSLSQLSNESSSSSSSSLSSLSSQSRATRRTQEQIARASRPIAPKAKKTNLASTPLVRVPTADGNSKEVAQIPKAESPQRPTRQRTFCDRCEDHPEGFHGEHELRRHIERLHTVVRRVWVCKDNSPDGKFLANCKACRSGKTYGANYNAAAHLRRTHFHPCKKGRGGRGKPSEKRGGKGGGDDPPMEVLKDWMYQKEELVPVDYVNHSLMPRNAEEEDFEADSSGEDDGLDHEAPPMMASSRRCTFGTESQLNNPAAIPRQLSTMVHDARDVGIASNGPHTADSAYNLSTSASSLYSRVQGAMLTNRPFA